MFVTDQPIACALPSADARDRSELIARLREDAMLDQAPIEDGLRIRFRDARDVEQRVRDLVAAEQACCPFLRFAVRRDDKTIALDVTGAPEAQPVIAAFFAAA